MADMKSAMALIANQINFDDEPDAPVAGNKSEAIWEFVKKHPKSQCKHIANGVGLTEQRTSGVLLALWQRGALERGGVPLHYTAVGDTYASTRKTYTLTKGTRPAKTERTPSPSRIKTKAKAKATPKAEATPYDAATLLATIPVVQARKLYDELKKVFG
jgi:hypothetical protein